MHSIATAQRVAVASLRSYVLKRCAAQTEEARDAKLARYIAMHDQAQAGAQHQAQEAAAGPISGGPEQTGATRSSGPRGMEQGVSTNHSLGSLTHPPAGATRPAGHAAGSSTGPPASAPGVAGAAGAEASVVRQHVPGGQEVRTADEAIPAGCDAPHAKRVRRGDDDEMSELVEYLFNGVKTRSTRRVHVVTEQDGAQEINRIEKDPRERYLSGKYFVKP